jgi:AsmA-like protein/uncharacterized protein DUF3971
MTASPAAPRHRSPAPVLAVVLGGLAALVLLSWAVLAVLFPSDRLRAIVEAQASRSLTRSVRFESVSLGLFPPVRLTVRKPALAEAGGFARGTAFEAASMHLDLDVLQLLRRRVQVRRLVLDEPALHLMVTPDGHNNLEGVVRETPEARRTSEPMDLSIHELKIRRGRLLLDDLASRRRRSVTIDSRVTLDVGRGGQRISTSGATTFSRFAFGSTTATSWSDMDTSLADLAPRIEHRGAYDAEQHRLALDRLALVLGSAELAARGIVDDPGPAARFDLTGRGQGIDFGQVIDAVSKADARALHGVRGSGRMSFDLRLLGGIAPAARRIATGTLTVQDGAFRYPGAAASVEALGFTARFAPDSIGVGDLSARVSGQPVRARLSVVRLQDPIVDFAVKGNLDLAAVAPMLSAPDTRLSGRAAVDVSGRGGARDPGALELSGTARLSNVAVDTPRVPKKIERIEGTVSFSRARARVTGLTAHAGTSAVTLDADVSRPLALLEPIGKTPPADLTFSLRSPRLDVADLVPAGSGPLIVPNATGTGSIEIDRLLNQKLDAKNVRADLALEPGIIQARSFTLQAHEGTLAGLARLDLRDPAKPGVTFEAQAAGIGANSLLSTWTPVRGVMRGTLDGSVKLALSGQQPSQMLQTLTAIGLARVTQGELGPIRALDEIASLVRVPGLERLKFDARQLPFRVERGRIVTDAVDLDGPTGRWRLSGAIGFDGTLDYAASITLPPQTAQSLHAASAVAAGALQDDQGNLLIDLRITGPARAPRVTIDTAAMRDRIAGRASKAILDQRDKLEQQTRDAAESRRKAAEDSLRRVVDRARDAARDSLRQKAGDLLRGFFGGDAKDTTASKP